MIHEQLRTHLVAATVVKVVVGGELADELYALLLGGLDDLWDVIGIDGEGLVDLVVDEEVGVVVVTNGDGKDLHPVSGGS